MKKIVLAIRKLLFKKSTHAAPKSTAVHIRWEDGKMIFRDIDLDSVTF